MKKSILPILFLLMHLDFPGLNAQKPYTLDDTLRGSITPQRDWWDLKYYALKVEVVPADKFLKGVNQIVYKKIKTGEVMQIDLQIPMEILSVEQNGKQLTFQKKGNNAYFINTDPSLKIGETGDIKVYYSGKPQIAKRAPWDGGLSWDTDSNGKTFAATSCQGLGASVWWPCKDHMYDEPDSMRIAVTVPDSLWDISNGRLEKMCLTNDGKRTTEWVVRNPINNYGVNLNIGDYVHFNEIFKGEKGDLTCDYFVLKENLEKAKNQFKDVSRMLQAFEYWFGPYPFYEDGYKLVEVPYLGMEHQSSVTYGNKFKNGYLGKDLSGSGWGLKWDFIIIHESGHEWFANNITYKDIADMWIHESFTNYSETLFTEFHYGKQAGEDYVIGTRKSILNDRPIIGVYNMNKSGSGDMYSKGGNMIHTIRHAINNDEKFREILRGLNSEFYHQTVETSQIENYISQKSGIDFSKVFDQYLRNTKIPELELKKTKKGYQYRWTNVVSGFDLPLKVKIDGKEQMIYPKDSRIQSISGKQLEVDRNFYITVKQ